MRSEIFRLRHADGVIAAIDEHHLARSAGAEIREEIERRAADILQRGVAAEGVVLLNLLASASWYTLLL